MQRSVFNHFLQRFNEQMRHAQRNIILLLDNASSHNAETIQNLSNIYVHFLPPNTTSCLQPIDQGIGYSLKVNFPYELSLYELQLIELTFIVFSCRHNIDTFYVKTILMLTMLLLKKIQFPLLLLYMMQLTLQLVHGKLLRQIQLSVAGIGLIFFLQQCQRQTILILHPRKVN